MKKIDVFLHLPYKRSSWMVNLNELMIYFSDELNYEVTFHTFQRKKNFKELRNDLPTSIKIKNYSYIYLIAQQIDLRILRKIKINYLLKFITLFRRNKKIKTDLFLDMFYFESVYFDNSLFDVETKNFWSFNHLQCINLDKNNNPIKYKFLEQNDLNYRISKVQKKYNDFKYLTFLNQEEYEYLPEIFTNGNNTKKLTMLPLKINNFTKPNKVTQNLKFIMPHRISEEKRSIEIIKIFEELYKKGHTNFSLRFLSVNDGTKNKYLNEFISYAKNTIIKEKIILEKTLPVLEVQELIKKSDVCLLYSLFEGVNFAIPTAQSLNVPAISYVQHGYTHIWFKKDYYGWNTKSEKEFKSTLEKLLKNFSLVEEKKLKLFDDNNKFNNLKLDWKNELETI